MVLRGANDSAPVEDLLFDFNLVEFEKSYLWFWLDFKNPQFVSIGSEKDILNITWVDTKILKDVKTGKQVRNNITLYYNIPKMTEDD